MKSLLSGCHDNNISVTKPEHMAGRKGCFRECCTGYRKSS